MITNVTSVHIRCLGTVSVVHSDGETSLSRAQRRIIAILTAAGPQGLSSAAFADELYGDDLPDGWEASVRQAISRMRKALGVGAIATRNGRYALDLDENEIDVWKLLAGDKIDLAALTEFELQDLLAGEPFEDVEPSPLLLQTLEPIASARIELIGRMVNSDRVWDRGTLLVACTLAARSHYRDDVLVAVLELHQRAGRSSEAAELGNTAATFLQQDFGLELSPQAARLSAPPHSTGSAATQAPTSADHQVGRVVGIYDPGIELAMIERSDLQDDVSDMILSGGIVVEGDSGSGKSALVRALAVDASLSGYHVLWLAGRTGTPTAYEPFIAAMPALEADLAPLLADGGDELERSRCWAAARRTLLGHFSGLPLIIVIDDAQWLDSHSRAFTAFLVASQGLDAPRLAVIGRSDPAAPYWESFKEQLRRVGLATVQVGAFIRPELVRLIGLQHHGATSKQRSDFADSLIASRSALPAIAHEIVQSADPATLTVASAGFGSQSATMRAGIWAHRVGESTRRVAALGATLGMRFRVRALAQLGELDVERVLEALDELLDANLIVAEQRPDEFSFRHVLIHADFDAVLDRGERRRLHLQASETAHAAGRVHEHARHLLEAGAIVDNETAVQALLASARLFKQQGSFREAVTAFARARQQADGELAADDLISYASAVASGGGDGWALRTAAFEQVLADSDVDASFEALVAETQHSEDTAGDLRRVALLERVERTALSPDRKAKHSAALARELALLGRIDQALKVSSDAITAATNANERLEAWLGSWVACRALPPAQWLDLPADCDQADDPELAARLAQVRCARAMQEGDDRTARSYHQDVEVNPFVMTDPVRRWHAALVRSMVAFVDGNWAESNRIADASFAEASDDGITAATSGRLAQAFAIEWVVGRHGALLSQIEQSPPDVALPSLAQAARAITLAEHEEHRSDARDLITSYALRATEPGPFSHPAAALMASVPAECLTPETRHTLRGTLEPFDGLALIAGASIAHLGPTSLSLARLATDHDERISRLRTAVEQADQWNLRVWSVRCRLDLAATIGDAALVDEARELADGTALEALLPS